MTLVDETSTPPRDDFPALSFLANACVSYDDTDLTKATYFELRPILDGEYTCSSYLYGGNCNFVQIRMGRHGRPCELIAKYESRYARQACWDFFDLAKLKKPLWYSGNDILVSVIDSVDMVTSIAEQRFSEGDPELEELFVNTGLSENERASVLAKLDL